MHGSRGQEMPLLYDGMRYNNMNATAGGGHVIWTINNGTVQEYTIEVGALSAEAEVSGVRQNVDAEGRAAIPSAGSFFANYTNDNLQSTNNVADPGAGQRLTREDLGFQSRVRRSDQAGQAVVLRRLSLLGQ